MRWCHQLLAGKPSPYGKPFPPQDPQEASHSLCGDEVSTGFLISAFCCTFFLKKYFICVCVGQKRTSDSLRRTWVRVVVSQCEDAGNWTSVLWKTGQCSWALSQHSSISAPVLVFFLFFSFAVERIEPRALYTLDKFFTSDLQPTHFHIPLLLKIGEFLKAFYEYCYLKTCESF